MFDDGYTISLTSRRDQYLLILGQTRLQQLRDWPDTDAEIEQQAEAVITEVVAPKSWIWDPMGSKVTTEGLGS